MQDDECLATFRVKKDDVPVVVLSARGLGSNPGPHGLAHPTWRSRQDKHRQFSSQSAPLWLKPKILAISHDSGDRTCSSWGIFCELTLLATQLDYSKTSSSATIIAR